MWKKDLNIKAGARQVQDNAKSWEKVIIYGIIESLSLSC